MATTWRVARGQQSNEIPIPFPKMVQRGQSPEPQPPRSPRQEGWNCEGCNRWRPFSHAETLCPQCGAPGLCLPEWAETWHDVFLATPSPAPQLSLQDRRCETAAAAARSGEDEEEGPLREKMRRDRGKAEEIRPPSQSTLWKRSEATWLRERWPRLDATLVGKGLWQNHG